MWRIPLSDLNYGPEEERAVLDVLRSRWLTMGPRTEEFEAAVAQYVGAKHAIAVANCTCALELAYSYCFELTERPVVVVPDITFVATLNAALVHGARAGICDIASPGEPLATVEQMQNAFGSSSAKDACIAIMHYGGFDSHAREFQEYTRSVGALLIEDAAHAIGAQAADGRPLGTFGLFGCFSFFSNKNLATGEGGMIVTNDDAAGARLRLLRSHGMTALTYERFSQHRSGYDVVSVGHNYRCSEIMAALGIEQLRKLDEANARRRQLYRLYRDALVDVPSVEVAMSDDDRVCRSACHILPLLCNSREHRDSLREAMTAAGVQTSHHYAPLSQFSAFDASAGMYPVASDGTPNARAFSERELTLPLHPGLKDIEVEEICSIIRRSAKEV